MAEKAELFSSKTVKEKSKEAHAVEHPIGEGSRSILTSEQVAELKKPLDEKRIERRKAKFGSVEYLPTWDIIQRANEIFGYGGWHRQIVRLEKVYAEEDEGTYNVAYLCEYRIIIGDIVHEDVGFGTAVNYPEATTAHEKAVKTAVSDGLKRCFRALGPQFGLTLYQHGVGREVEEYQPTDVRKATEKQVGRLHGDLKTHGLSEQDLLDYVNLRMGGDYSSLKELPLKVASRAINRFAKEGDAFVQEIKSRAGDAGGV
jgi:DNA recombination protein Rad52